MWQVYDNDQFLGYVYSQADADYCQEMGYQVTRIQ